MMAISYNRQTLTLRVFRKRMNKSALVRVKHSFFPAGHRPWHWQIAIINHIVRLGWFIGDVGPTRILCRAKGDIFSGGMNRGCGSWILICLLNGGERVMAEGRLTDGCKVARMIIYRYFESWIHRKCADIFILLSIDYYIFIGVERKHKY